MVRTGLKHTDEDKALIECIRNGSKSSSEQAVAKLFARHKSSLLTFVQKIVGNQEDAEDVMMVSFMKAMSSLSTFDNTRVFTTWLYKIATNTALDQLKKKNVSGDSIDGTPSEGKNDPAQEGPTPLEEIIRQEQYERFLSCIEGLPELYRLPMKLLILEHKDYNEIASSTGLGLNTVKTRISRGKALIMNYMHEKEEE